MPLFSKCNDKSSNINDGLRLAQHEGSTAELMKRPGSLTFSSPVVFVCLSVPSPAGCCIIADSSDTHKKSTVLSQNVCSVQCSCIGAICGKLRLLAAVLLELLKAFFVFGHYMYSG